MCNERLEPATVKHQRHVLDNSGSASVCKTRYYTKQNKYKVYFSFPYSMAHEAKSSRNDTIVIYWLKWYNLRNTPYATA